MPEPCSPSSVGKKGADLAYYHIAGAVVFIFAIGLYATVALLRAPGFDETSLAVIAQDWLRGHVPFERVADNKPIGAYAVLATGLAVFGNNLFGLRVLQILIVGTNGVLAAVLVGRNISLRSAPWVGSAVILGILALEFGFFDTEMVVTAFALLAILVLAEDPWQPWRCGAAGCLLGVASMCKQVAVLYLAALVLLALASAFSEKLRAKRAMFCSMIACAGFAIPWLLAILWYWRLGLFAEFWFWTVLFPLENLKVYHGQALFFWIRSSIVFAPLAVATLLRVFRPRESACFLVDFALLAACLSILPIAKRFHAHYLIPVLVPTLIALSPWLRLPSEIPTRTFPRSRKVAAGLLALLTVAVLFVTYQRRDLVLSLFSGSERLRLSALAVDIESHARPGDIVFLPDPCPTHASKLYFMTNTVPSGGVTAIKKNLSELIQPDMSVRVLADLKAKRVSVMLWPSDYIRESWMYPHFRREFEDISVIVREEFIPIPGTESRWKYPLLVHKRAFSRSGQSTQGPDRQGMTDLAGDQKAGAPTSRALR